MMHRNCIFFFAIFLSFGCKIKKHDVNNEMPKTVFIKEDNAYLMRIDNKIIEINSFLENKNGYNKDFAFLLDMKISSGKNRFFVVNLKNGKIINRGLVAHGYGSNILISDSLQFSNVPNSMATSLGKYRIGKSYYGKFGKSYKLYGLDKTNSNAYARNIVLHGYKYVPELEVKGTICNSKGCPMVSYGFFKEIDGLIEQSKSNILLYVYY